MHKSLIRAETFCRRFGLQAPVLLAPMAGVSSPSLSIAVANAGGLGSCGVLLMPPGEILTWVKQVKAHTSGPIQLNNWIPGPPPKRDPMHEAEVKHFLSKWGPMPENGSGPPDFAEQCEAMLQADVPMLSSVMGLFPPDFVVRMKQKDIIWCANISTVAEAKAAEKAGADIIVAQGSEAGGHRGTFNGEEAEAKLVGLFSLLPAVVDAVKLPVVATGGIADGRGAAAAFLLGASAVQVGTGFLRCPEAKISQAWADALANTAPEDTVITRAFSGKPGRSIATNYVRAAMALDAPAPAPYPVQRGLTAAMRKLGHATNDLHRIQAWAGQSASLAQAEPAGSVLENIWMSAKSLLS